MASSLSSVFSFCCLKYYLSKPALAVLLVISLTIAPLAGAKSINPTMRFQQDPQHTEYNGLAHVILKEAYRRIGHPVHRQAADKFGADGILISPIKSSLNAEYIRIPIPIVQLKVFAYAHKSHQGTAYEFGLLGNRISIVEGMPLIQNNMMGLVTAKMSSVNRSLESIVRDELDIVLLPEFSAIGRSKKHLLAQLTALQPAVYEVAMYHYVHKENSHLVAGLKRTLRKMEKLEMISHVTNSYKIVLKADAEA